MTNNQSSDEKFNKDSVIDEIFNNAGSLSDVEFVPVQPHVEENSLSGTDVDVNENELDDVFVIDSNFIADESDESNVSNGQLEAEVSTKTFSSDEYFEDDEDFLAGDDEVVHDGNVLSIFQQEDNVVSVEVMNLYTESGNLRNKIQLRSDPPILQVKSSDGQLAQFVLTKNFSQSLSAKLDDVSSAYYGLESKSSKLRKSQEKAKNKVSFGDFLNKIGDWAVDNKLKSGLLLIVVLLIVFGIFF